MYIKNFIRRLLILTKIDLTKNIKYDRLSQIILKQFSSKLTRNAIDIGSHDGDFLNLFLKYSPDGVHMAFEPLPHKYEIINKRYSNLCEVYPYALSNYVGESEFCFVKNAEAYSGLKPRRYDVKKPLVEKIKVDVRTIDSMKIKHRVDFIKIDV